MRHIQRIEHIATILLVLILSLLGLWLALTGIGWMYQLWLDEAVDRAWVMPFVIVPFAGAMGALLLYWLVRVLGGVEPSTGHPYQDGSDEGFWYD